MKNIPQLFFTLFLATVTTTNLVAQVMPAAKNDQKTISAKEHSNFKSKLNTWRNTAKGLEEYKLFVDIEHIKAIETDLDNVQKVNLQTELAKVFDPEKQACPLPDKLKSKLQKDKEKGKQFIPQIVKSSIEGLPDTFYTMPRKSLAYVLHVVELTKPSGLKYERVLTNAPNYNTINFEKFIDGASNRFFYSLDCSGYLNAAISGSATVPGMADLKSKAESALKSENSMFVAGGVILSPIYAAFTGEVANLSAQERVAILNSLISLYDIDDADTVDINIGYEAIWASGKGSSNFNGSADLKASAGGSVAVASINATTQGGGTISRSSSFTNFNTYITPGFPLPQRKKPTVKMVKDLVATLQKGNSK